MKVRALPHLSGSAYRDYRRRAIFSCHKWDPQVEDVATITPFALALAHGEWRHLEQWARQLTAETLACEDELWNRPDLHHLLGLSWSMRMALRWGRRQGRPRAAARVMRFDFHPTAAGWALSEVNSDVPGGFNEATGLTSLMHEHHPDLAMAGDPARQLAARIRACTTDRPVALVHCSAYSDDRQVMEFLADHLHAIGVATTACAPDALRWRDAGVSVGDGGPCGAIMRFYPAEWLPALPLGCHWWRFFAGDGVPATNPGSAVLVQGKRLPLLWERLRTRLPIWRALLPETCAVAEVADWNDGWLLKPAWGRVGEGIVGPGFGLVRDWDKARSASRRHPHLWLAQRTFTSQPIAGPFGPAHVCLGVYTIDGEPAGIYGRIAQTPPINRLAQEVAVLVDPPRDARGAA